MLKIKHLVLGIIIATTVVSCKKEVIIKEVPVAITKDCKCGEVIERTKEGISFGNPSYSYSDIRVKNYCTGKIFKFTKWTKPMMYVQVGEEYCSTVEW